SSSLRRNSSCSCRSCFARAGPSGGNSSSSGKRVFSSSSRCVTNCVLKKFSSSCSRAKTRRASMASGGISSTPISRRACTRSSTSWWSCSSVAYASANALASIVLPFVGPPSLELHQHLPRLHGVAHRGVHAGDLARHRRRDDRLHLHRLQHQQH